MTPRLLAVLATTALVATVAACSSSSAPEPDAAAVTAPTTVVVSDDFGRDVQVPVEPERIAVLEWEGLVTKSLTMLGEDSRLVAVDSATKKDPFRLALSQGVAGATDVGSPWSGVNYEALATTRPEVLFMEAWVSSDEDRQLHEEAVEAIENLGIPVIVFLSPSNVDVPDMSTAYEVIDSVGTVLDRRADTDRVVATLRSGIEAVVARVPELADAERPTVAVFATEAYVMGEKSIQSHLFTELLGARNVAGPGTFVPISEEQLLAMDPDVLVIAGHEGYLGADEVMDGARIGLDWSRLSDLRAIREGRVVALGYDEWRATIETPVALQKVAAVLYPDQFADVDVEQAEIAFYQDVFEMTEQQARDAAAGQRYRQDLAEG